MNPEQLTPAPSAVGVGTSLEVLQHYLTAGIDVQVTSLHEFTQTLQTWRGKLLGLTSRPDNKPVEVLIGQTPGCWALADVLPCLLPFGALCTPLADGTVPALRAFKAVLTDEPEPLDWDAATCLLSRPAPHSKPDVWVITLFVPIVGLNGGHMLRLYNDWTLQNLDQAKHRIYLNALLAEHAAVGLEPHQYLAKGPENG